MVIASVCFQRNSLMTKYTLFLSIFLVCSAAYSVEPKIIELRQNGELILEIPLDESVPVEIDAMSGWLRAAATSEFSCNQDAANCDDVEVSMSGANGTFSRSPSSVARGSSVNFNWTSRGAWECEGLGLPGTAWQNGGKLPNGSQSVTLDIEPGTYEASIRCTNGPVEATRGPLEITVTPPEADIPANCQGRQPSGMTRLAACAQGSTSVDCFQYEAVYRAEFPGLAQGRQILANRDQYIAMEFTVPMDIPANSQGSWSFVVPQLPPTQTGPNMQTISRCPGDFDREKIVEEMDAACYIKQGVNNALSVRWAIDGSSSTNRCKLTPGETYFFNILYTNSDFGTPPSQLNWRCGGSDSFNVCSHNTEAIF